MREGLFGSFRVTFALSVLVGVGVPVSMLGKFPEDIRWKMVIFVGIVSFFSFRALAFISRLATTFSHEEFSPKVMNRSVGKEVQLVRSLSIKFVVIALIIFSISEAWGARWKYYGTNENGWYFYETESMTWPSENVVVVLVQSAYTEKGVSHWVREGGKEFQNLGYSLVWCELNCAERATRHLQIVFYSKDKETFYPIRNDEWQLFVPDSMFELLYKEVCK